MKFLKKTTATLLVAIFILSITATAIPIMSVGAQAPVDYETSLLDAADRLTEQQNTGDGYDEGYIGGFRMWISETPPGTYLRTHNIGVTAIGILKAHELQDKTEYETALAMAYKFVVDHVPGWIQDPVDTTRWKESPGGVNSWPDIHFLIDLAEAATLDSSLLAAIQSEVSETTADDIVELAKDRWDDRLNHAGAVFPSEVGTATGMAEWLLYVRTPDYMSLIPWDLEAAVKSAVALHEKYPEDGYLAQAQDIANVIYDCIFVEDPPYLDVTDTEEEFYTLGLAGAIESFGETGLYSVEAGELKDLLVAYQNEAGFWDGSELSEQEGVQETAYTIMALLAQGDNDAKMSALEGANWLVSTQDELGGWDPSSVGSDGENLECNGEAAWAIYEIIQEIGTVEIDHFSDGTVDLKTITIQQAVDAAYSGDTITVKAGTYVEAVKITTAGITLQGEPGAIIRPDDTTPTHDGNRRVAIKIQQVDGVTVEGFEIDGTGGIVHYGIYPFNSHNTIVRNNVVHDITNEIGAPGFDVAGVGIIYFGWEQGIDGALIESNIVYNTGRMGIGVTAWGPSSWRVCSDINIKDNTVYSTWQGPTNDHGGAIQINIAKDCSITDNEVYNVQHGQRGIYMFGSAAGNTITSNTIRNNPIGIEFWISGEGGGDMIAWEGETATSPQVHYNNIYDNDIGASNYNSEGTQIMTLNATQNYWGRGSGPTGPDGRTNKAGKEIGEGDAIFGDVDWDPYLPQPVFHTKHDPVPPGLR